jgi:ATP-dependent Clp protease ATP-binding subunit ClpC
MFEDFTERARRVIYFANREAGQFGSTTIETEHLLLGLIREDDLTSRFLQHPFPVAEIRAEVERRIVKQPGVSANVDMPLSVECGRILHHAVEEAALLNHRHVRTDHLFLGLLREPSTVGAQVLRACGLDEDVVRRQLSGDEHDDGQE